MTSKMGKGSYTSINEHDVKQTKIPLPSLETQKQLVANAKKEEEIIEANKRLVEISEEKINKVIESI